MSVPTVRLADVATRIGSGITPRGGSAVYKTAGRPFMRSQNVGWGDLRLDDMAYIDEATHSSFPATEIRTGDVLLNITGASIGRSAVATPALDGGNVNQHVCEIRLKSERMDPRFVNAFLLSRSGQSQIDMFQAGGNRQGLNFQQVGSIQVPDLPIEQQCAIGAASQNADDLITTLERLIAKKQAIKQGMMQQLLTGSTRLTGYSGGWESTKLGAVAKMGSGGTPPSRVAKYYGDGIPWVSITDMTSGGKYIAHTENTLTEEGLGTSGARLYESDVVLYAMYASVGECSLAVGRVSSSQAILGIEPSSRLDREFLYYWLQYSKPRVKSLGQQGTQSNLNARMVREFELELPRLEEQIAIRTVLSEVDHEILVLENRLEKACNIKVGMMQQLLTGRTRLPAEAST